MRAFLRWLTQPIVQTALLLIWCGFFLGVATVTNDWLLAAIFAVLLVAFVVIFRHECAQQRQIIVNIRWDMSGVLDALEKAREEVDHLGTDARGH